MISGIIDLVVALFQFLMGRKKDAVAQATEVSNQVGHVSAEVSRDTTAQLNEDLQNASAQTSAAVDAVRNAGSVCDQQSAVDAAIARANSPADPHG